MKLRPEAIAEYQDIYRREHGREISTTAAEQEGRELIELYQFLITQRRKRE